MTLEEAREQSLNQFGQVIETNYLVVLARVWEGEPDRSIALERIFVKEKKSVEIRLSWRNENGQFQPRPADIESDYSGWGQLFAKAIRQGVFNPEEQLAMLRVLLNPKVDS